MVRVTGLEPARGIWFSGHPTGILARRVYLISPHSRLEWAFQDANAALKGPDPANDNRKSDHLRCANTLFCRIIYTQFPLLIQPLEARQCAHGNGYLPPPWAFCVIASLCASARPLLGVTPQDHTQQKLRAVTFRMSLDPHCRLYRQSILRAPNRRRKLLRRCAPKHR